MRVLAHIHTFNDADLKFFEWHPFDATRRAVTRFISRCRIDR